MKTETRIRVAASIAMATALWAILPDWRSHLFLLHGLRGCAQITGLGIALSVLLFKLVLLSQLVAAVGLFWYRRWAWVLAVVSLSVLILFPAISAVRLLLFPPPPPSPAEHTVTTLSLLPLYIRAGINGIAVLLLFSQSVRTYFLNANTESHNKIPGVCF